MGDLMASKDKNIHEIKRDIAKKKQIKADHHKEQILQFFAYRGDIMIQLQKYEEAYFSFAKALSFSGNTPKVNLSQNTPDI